MRFRISLAREGEEAITLLLTSTLQPDVVWRKRYNNRLEMGFDALELNLLDSLPSADNAKGFRRWLREEADIDEQDLSRLRFTRME